MPLNPKVLEDELLKQSEDANNGVNITYVDFVSAVEKYAMSIQYPPPNGVPTAAKLLKSLLSAIPTSPPLPIAVPIMKVAIQVFALGIALGKPFNGIATAPNFTPGAGSGTFPTVPPAGQPAIDSILNQPNDKEIVAKQLANAIHIYMITGQYDGLGFVTTTPGGSPLPVQGPTPWT
tara:strand:+ start:115 stop:645 length:531 start_codon:yes stop_codon:yes gene_type:complete